MSLYEIILGCLSDNPLENKEDEVVKRVESLLEIENSREEIVVLLQHLKLDNLVDICGSIKLNGKSYPFYGKASNVINRG